MIRFRNNNPLDCRKDNLRLLKKNKPFDLLDDVKDGQLEIRRLALDDLSLTLIPLSKGHVALVDSVDAELVNKFGWSLVTPAGGYFALCTSKKLKKIYDGNYLHRLITLAKKGQQVGFHNKNTLDCRRENLFLGSRQEMLRHKRGDRDTSSKFKGVRTRPNGNYTAQIYDGQLKIHLGTFAKEGLAALAYNKASRIIFGTEVNLENILDDPGFFADDEPIPFFDPPVKVPETTVRLRGGVKGKPSFENQCIVDTAQLNFEESHDSFVISWQIDGEWRRLVLASTSKLNSEIIFERLVNFAKTSQRTIHSEYLTDNRNKLFRTKKKEALDGTDPDQD